MVDLVSVKVGQRLCPLTSILRGRIRRVTIFRVGQLDADQNHAADAKKRNAFGPSRTQFKTRLKAFRQVDSPRNERLSDRLES